MPQRHGRHPHRGRPARAEEGKATAYALGHAAGASLGRRAGRAAQGAPRADQVAPPRLTRGFASRSISRLPVRAARARAFRPSIPHFATFTSASRMLDPLILETPSSRSVKVIGTSTTTNPLLRLRRVKSI